jgi:hypothetical protein
VARNPNFAKLQAGYLFPEVSVFWLCARSDQQQRRRSAPPPPPSAERGDTPRTHT